MNNYLDFAKELAEEAGAVMTKYFQAEDIGHEWKEDNTPLTIADTTINNLVIEKVKEKFPLHGVLGEEGIYHPDRQHVWVVDPVDGTVPFSLSMPISTFSLALVDRSDGQPVIGVVYDPYLKNLYSAAFGEGAFLNSKRLKTADVSDLPKTYVSVLGGIPRDKSIYFKPGKCTDILRDKGASVMSLISQVYVAAKVASGDLSGSIFGYGAPWDAAATALIVREAGGVVTDLEGNGRRYDEPGLGCVFAANEHIHSILLAAIKASKT
jgi:myo-inositol-1(or 4)-monophosphatase